MAKPGRPTSSATTAFSVHKPDMQVQTSAFPAVCISFRFAVRSSNTEHPVVHQLGPGESKGRARMTSIKRLPEQVGIDC
jgi:hypothetical protein